MIKMEQIRRGSSKEKIADRSVIGPLLDSQSSLGKRGIGCSVCCGRRYFTIVQQSEWKINMQMV